MLQSILIWLILFGAQPTGDAPPPPQPQQLTEIRNAIGEADETIRQQAAPPLEAAARFMDRAAAAEKATAQFAAEIQGAPDRLETIKKELTAPLPEPEPVDPGQSAAQIESRLTQTQAKLETDRLKALELNAEDARRDRRRSEINETIRAAQSRIDEIDDSPIAQGESEPGLVFEARQLAHRAELYALRKEVEAGNKELESYAARRELLPQRVAKANRDVTRTEREVAYLTQALNDQRRVEADASKKETQSTDVQSLPESLKPIQKRNLELATINADVEDGSLRAKLEQTQFDLQSRRSTLTNLESEHAILKEETRSGRSGRVTGYKLRDNYSSLPSAWQLRQRLAEIKREYDDTRYEQFLIEDDINELADIESRIEELEVAQKLVRIEQNGRLARYENAERTEKTRMLESIELPAEFGSTARTLLVRQNELLSEAKKTIDAYVVALGDLEVVLETTISQVRESRELIEEHILWVRSVPPTYDFTFGDIVTGVAWLTDLRSWSDVAGHTIENLRTDWIEPLTLTLVLVLMITLHVRCGRMLKQIAPLVLSYGTDSFRLTLRAVVLTLVLALPGPAIMLVIAWLVGRPEKQIDFGIALATGLQAAAFVLLPLSLIRHTLRPAGLCDSHFRWHPKSVSSIRRHLVWLMLILVPARGLAIMLSHQAVDVNITYSVGRLAFIVAMVAVAVFAWIIMRPNGATMKGYLVRNAGGWVERARFGLVALAVGIPVLLAAITVGGYYYTAARLEEKIEITAWLLAALVVLNAIFHRWLFIARRRLAIEQARRKREQSSEETAEPLDADRVDVPAISAQTRRLFRSFITVAVLVGAYTVWADALPALRYLDRVQIWPSITFVDPDVSDAQVELQPPPTSGSTETNGASTPVASVVEDAESNSLADARVSLADLGLAIILVIATVAAVRNLPALIEIILLQRLPLDAGSRYALSTVTRYFIAIVGLTASFNALGIGWSKVQWLAAALTFGLGFGLQEIFANFVSGLIMLAERPIRLGDTVTVGSTSGVVSRIRMRATTITDWDRKELVIPNKAFITGEVINWTLSDPTLRVVIPVGVSYESDVRLVRERLLEVAHRHGKVLKEPAPQALFRSFGDSTLDFELRVFIPHIDHLLETKHELQIAIILDFRARGIEIAFPQRDLHIRSGLEALHPPESTEGHPEGERDQDKPADHRPEPPRT